jgi:hypothetical protein
VVTALCSCKNSKKLTGGLFQPPLPIGILWGNPLLEKERTFGATSMKIKNRTQVSTFFNRFSLISLK